MSDDVCWIWLCGRYPSATGRLSKEKCLLDGS
jgi:acyl transferase domain-containing protein